MSNSGKKSAVISLIRGGNGLTITGAKLRQFTPELHQLLIPERQLAILAALAQQRIALFQQTPHPSPQGEEGRLLMEDAPVQPGPASLGPAGQQVEAIGVDQLHRQQLCQIGQSLGLGPGDLELGLTTLVLGESNGYLTPLQFALSKQGKGPLPLADDPPGQVSTKGATKAKVVNGFQNAGLATAIAPDQDVEAGGQLETGLLDIAKVAELEFDQGHD